MLIPRSVSSLPLPKASLTALHKAGFETVSDLENITLEQLSAELRVPPSACAEILSAASTTAHKAPTSTQPASTLLAIAKKSFSLSAPADLLLGGGLKLGYITEISGPPGCPKERMAVCAVRSAVQNGDNVLFVDTQSMVSPTTLMKSLKGPNSFMPVSSKISLTLADEPRAPQLTSLVVLNSLSFLFQPTSKHTLSNASRNSILERLKHNLSKICASKPVAFVITTNLATKLLDADGSPANFETGKKAVMVPQLGITYLPPGRTYRIMAIRDSPNTGSV
ncbi:hypothetical protein BD410DRAFT_718050 [Rickenella mellea]|uniref:RecA family profile 1 domain-containing protein n=1 Tax=Rickenella mellea TaxID=50990 RepID=A0A4Y7QCR5_9AGAM|nr:hypothetical protein BD410DRAFT_718050 [Rickenella mellea]